MIFSTSIGVKKSDSDMFDVQISDVQMCGFFNICADKNLNIYTFTNFNIILYFKRSYRPCKKSAHLHIRTSANHYICNPQTCPSYMILVTGATGFLGSELALQLVKQGYSLRCTKRNSSFIPAILVPFEKQIEWVDADLMNVFELEEALIGVTQVYHCAAWVSLKRTDKKAMIKTNITGTANLVDLCLSQQIRLVHVSSVAAIGIAKPGELTTENHHLDLDREDDGYAISKLESEMEVWRGIAEGLDAVIVNPSIIIGANAGIKGSGQLFETVRKGLKFYTSGSCGFVDVEDVAKCMIALMNSKITAERYIISAENRNYQQLTTEIAEDFGVKPPSTHAGAFAMAIAWRGAALWAAITGSDPAVDKVSAQAALINRDYDNSKIKKAIGIEFKPISQSIKEICEKLSPS
jgi:dihydroflavonol-4-reductase